MSVPQADSTADANGNELALRIVVAHQHNFFLVSLHLTRLELGALIKNINDAFDAGVGDGVEGVREGDRADGTARGLGLRAVLLSSHELAVAPQRLVDDFRVVNLEGTRKRRHNNTAVLVVAHRCDLLLGPLPAPRFDDLEVELRVHLEHDHLALLVVLAVSFTLSADAQQHIARVVVLADAHLRDHVLDSQGLDVDELAVHTRLLELLNLNFSGN